LLRLIILSLMSFDKVWGGKLHWRLEFWTWYLVIVSPLLHHTPLISSYKCCCLSRWESCLRRLLFWIPLKLWHPLVWSWNWKK
jgi:hypothetical protein